MVIPKKRFGQHFLKDKNIIRKIVDGAGVSKDDLVLEIGPGLGDMTSLLCERAERVIAVELDRELYSILLEKFGRGTGENNVEIVNADALRFDIGGLFERFGKKIKVVANLPYNISTPLLFKFFEDRDYISSMTLMFQKEVADRLTAVPGTKDYGVLSIYAQLYTKPSFLFKVSPHAFTPPPKVDSAVVRLDVLKEPSVKAIDEGFMLKVVKAAFGQRRKTLSNALSSGLGLPKEAVNTTLKRAMVDGSRRGETLTLGEFCNLSDVFAADTL
ncbi:MAG: 16S rRNA (adenine(1518)-N(6)/adenine(1519)-N(6))-dimethyltransferase RsmA [Deltaproteobacteria bacterium]|nr:16S rRNA (adenine(1518)-N(6)/adenine(1519)-N(6))-dimethyltransferase RsmA [Deltaproteobacteria bacterium]